MFCTAVQIVTFIVSGMASWCLLTSVLYVFLRYRQTRPVKELPLAAIVTTPYM